MDVKAFSGDDFEVKDWINAAFKQPEAQANKEQYAQSLVMKLQLLIAKLNANLEDQSEHILQNMPRILREVESLQQESALLKCSMSAVQSDIDKVNQDTGESMATLVQYDVVKQRIQSTKKALKEADNWTTLTNEIEDALDNGDLSLISSKLNGIQNSLKILSHVVDYEDRVIHVEGLKNRLEALASPQLVQAFNTNDETRGKFFVQIFSDMDRSQQLLKYYRKCIRAKALKIWNQQLLIEDLTFVQNLEKYLASLKQQVIEDQMAWFLKVFPNENAGETTIDILIDVLLSMDPSIEFCLQAGIKQQSDQLTYLIQIKKIISDFLQHLDETIASLNAGGVKSQTRMRELSLVIYAPLKGSFDKYGAMESLHLMSSLQDNTQSSKDIIDELRLISMSVPKLITSFNDSTSRCFSLTEACAFPALIPSFEETLEKYLERFQNLIQRLEKRKTAAHSWNIVQQSLTLNQITGDLLLNLEQMDIDLSLQFLDRTKHFLGSSNEHGKAIHQYHLFFLETNSNGMKALLEFHANIKQGTMSYPVMFPLMKIVRNTCQEIQGSTFSILFHPVQEQLVTVDSVEMLDSVWMSSSAGSDSREPDMPDFSFSPQEYITQIGQYLMTLPQHLEPYMTHDNPALSRALKERVFPFCGSSGIARSKESDHDSNTPADFLLSCITKATCQTYQDHILKIPSLSINSTKQLYTDIGYLSDILEDLGHPITDNLASLNRLLRMPSKDFTAGNLNEEPHKLVTQVKQMRNIK